MKVKMLRARVVGRVSHDVGEEIDVEDSIAEYLKKEGDAEIIGDTLRQPLADAAPTIPPEPVDAASPEAEDKPATGPKKLGGK